MRSKFLKKLVAAATVLSMTAGVLGGCGSSKQGNSGVDNSVEDTKNLKIMIYAAGYGSEWLQKLGEAFEAKNEGVNVDITLATSLELMNSDIKDENSDTDLYFNISNGGGQALMESYKTAYKDGQAMRDLTYLVETEIPGEGITLGEKMNSSLKVAFQAGGRDTEGTSDDTYYFLPYMAAPMGLFYNETVIDEALGKGKWEIPNTTNELIELCKKLKQKDCHILIPSTLDQWAISMYLSWWAQYEGYENFMKFYQGIGYNEQKGREEQRSSLIYQQPGRLEALKTTYDLLAYENGFILSNTAEITANNLNEYQTRFTLKNNKYAFYPCGDWLLTELEERSVMEADSVIKMMKTPVISSIIDSANSYSTSDEKRLPNITSDAILSKVVAYVDGEGELPAGVTEQEVEVVREARSMMGTRSDIHMVYAPEFSNAKALADDFLLFMASDEGCRIIKESCIGGFPAYNWESTELEGTAQTVYEASKNATYVADYKISELFYLGGISGMVTGSDSTTIDGVFATPKSRNAEKVFNDVLGLYEGVRWQNILRKISN